MKNYSDRDTTPVCNGEKGSLVGYFFCELRGFMLMFSIFIVSKYVVLSDFDPFFGQNNKQAYVLRTRSLGGGLGKKKANGIERERQIESHLRISFEIISIFIEIVC